MTLYEKRQPTVLEKREKQGIARLRRRAATAQIASLLLGLLGLGCVCAVLIPTLFGIDQDQPKTLGGSLLWLLAGVSVTGIACFFFTLVTQWTRRLLWIRQNVAPVLMSLTLEVDESSDSTAFYARLHPMSGSSRASWRMSLWAKPPNLRSHLNETLPARVYFDPDSQKPAVVDFDHGILWSMAGSGSTEQVGDN